MIRKQIFTYAKRYKTTNKRKRKQIPKAYTRTSMDSKFWQCFRT